jgi:hypothetical protein
MEKKAFILLTFQKQTLVQGFELNAVSHIYVILGANFTGFEVNPLQIPHPWPVIASPYYCTKCAPTGNRTRNLQSHKGWTLINIPVRRPQTNGASRDVFLIYQYKSLTKNPRVISHILKGDFFCKPICADWSQRFYHAKAK